MLRVTFLFILFFSSTILSSASTETGIHYVNADKLKVRMAPSTKGKYVYSIKHKDQVTVHELKDGWARISYYDKKTSQAKWAFAKYLSPKSKPNKAKKTTKKITKKITKPKVEENFIEEKEITQDELLIEAISMSDDFETHKKTFELVSRRLVFEKTCKLSEFEKLNGWLRLYKDKIYFIYCGGYSRGHKIYLDVRTGVASK